MANKICAVCGKEFETRHSGKLTCSKECSYERHKENVRRNDRERRAADKAADMQYMVEKPKRESRIIGEGYAERQIAQTLAMVGRIQL